MCGWSARAAKKKPRRNGRCAERLGQIFFVWRLLRQVCEARRTVAVGELYFYLLVRPGLCQDFPMKSNHPDTESQQTL